MLYWFPLNPIKSKYQAVHEQKFKDLLSSTCQVSPERIVLDLKSEVMRGPGSIPTAQYCLFAKNSIGGPIGPTGSKFFQFDRGHPGSATVHHTTDKNSIYIYCLILTRTLHRTNNTVVKWVTHHCHCLHTFALNQSKEFHSQQTVPFTSLMKNCYSFWPLQPCHVDL